MQIPQNHLQFAKCPTLLVVSGGFEARFLVACDNLVEEREYLKMDPREEAKEKQGYIYESRGQELGSLSHHGAYMRDLKKKFSRKVGEIIDDLVTEEKVQEVYVFVPRYAEHRILDNLKSYDKIRIKKEIFGEYLYKNPVEVIEILENYLEKERSAITNHIHYTQNEKKILHRPKTKPSKI